MAGKKFLEPGKALIGVRFYRVLTYLRETPEHPKSKLLSDDFANNRTVVAQMSPFLCERYRDLPEDARSFVSRCSWHKRHNPLMTMEQIVREQYALVENDSKRLYAELICLMEQGLREMVWARVRDEMIAEWYEGASRDPLHAYHPEEIPEDSLKTELYVYG